MLHGCRRLTTHWLVFTAIVIVLIVDTRLARAADQTEHLKKTPTVLADPGEYINVQAGTLSYSSAAALMRVTFPREQTDSPDFYCVIQVLRWGTDVSTIDQSHWYVYRGRGTLTSYASRWTPARFAGQRVFGSDRIAFLYVHLNVPATTRAAALTELEPQLEKARAGGSTATVATLLPADGQPADDLKSKRGKPLRSIGAHIVETEYTNIAYQIDVVKKLPAPIQNLEAALGMLQAAPAPEPSVTLKEVVALHAAGVYDILHVPSDITISGKLTSGSELQSRTVDLGKQTYDNEGLYYWDVSLGIPIRSITQLDFETSGGEVFAKEVNESQLMALMNIFWRPVDTKNTKLLLVPSPIVGVALAKQPLKKMMVGLSMGLNKVQFYAGRQWTEIENAPVEAAEAPDPISTDKKYQQDWVMGINVPLRQVIDFLKAKK